MDNNNDLLFKHLENIFKNNLFENEELNEIFKSRIKNELHEITKKANSKNLQAYCSAALKNYKRDLITLHIKKIKEIEQIKLTTRTADLFFMSYLGRSVGEKYLCYHFSSDYNKRDIILTPDYKKHIITLIDKYKKQAIDNLFFITSMYKKLKQEIVYS